MFIPPLPRRRTIPIIAGIGGLFLTAEVIAKFAGEGAVEEVVILVVLVAAIVAAIAVGIAIAETVRGSQHQQATPAVGVRPVTWHQRDDDTVRLHTMTTAPPPAAPGIYVASPPDRFDLLRRELCTEFWRVQQETAEQIAEDVREAIGDHKAGVTETIDRLAQALPQPLSGVRRIH